MTFVADVAGGAGKFVAYVDRLRFIQMDKTVITLLLAWRDTCDTYDTYDGYDR